MHLFIGNLLFIHPLISFSTLHANRNPKSMDRGLIEKAASIVGILEESIKAQLMGTWDET